MLVASISRDGIWCQPGAHHTTRWWPCYSSLHVSNRFVSPLREIFVQFRSQLLYHSDVSRTSEISIQCYLRTEKPKRGAECDDMGNDIFMGGIKFKPDFDNRNTANEWYSITGGAGKIQIGFEYRPNSVSVFAMLHIIAVLIHFLCRANRCPLTHSNSSSSSAGVALAKSCKSERGILLVSTL